MARDNGSRGSYRRSDATEPTAQGQQQRSTSEANKPCRDEDATPKAMERTIFKDLLYMDGPNADHLSDQASDLLNARFPPMSVPGAIPCRQTSFFQSLGRQRPAPGWKDVGIATALYGSAAFGFGVIMWDGLEAMGGLLVEAGTRLMYEGMLRLGF